MTNHLLLSYGCEVEYQRAVFAVLSFWAWHQGDRSAVKTIVFTDRPGFFVPYFVGLPVEYRLLTPASLAQMRGAQDYIHRIKLCIISQIIKEQPNDALLFCDADTFFMSPAAALLGCLRPGYSILHKREHSFEEAIATWASFSPPQDEYPRKFIGLIKNQVFELQPDTHYSFSASQIMWNSGVVGLTAEIVVLMPAILALNDKFYAASHWIVSEQVALSLALQTQTEVLPSNQYVFHYWGKHQKNIMDGLLANLSICLPPAELLNERLESIRALTGTWKQAVYKEEAQQYAKLAFSKGELFNGMKFTFKALLSTHWPRRTNTHSGAYLGSFP